MEIGDWQQLGMPVGEPLCASQALTLRAMTVAAGVVGDTRLATVLAPFDMAAEGGCPTCLDGGHDPALSVGQAVSFRRAIGGTVVAEDIRHLQRGLDGGWSVGRSHRQVQANKKAGGV